ncbi:MAG TPA: hypothetical protein VFD70_11410 [Anaerolineae bacterium]|nr:hypothetical protein [Anaerolineae bacterium]
MRISLDKPIALGCWHMVEMISTLLSVHADDPTPRARRFDFLISDIPRHIKIFA